MSAGTIDARLAAELRAARRENLKPPPKLDLVQWADAHRYLSAEAAAEPGRWQTSRVEVARGPMLAISDPECRHVTIMACTQLMKTELILNIIGYFVHQDPAPMIVLQPTVDLAKAFSKDRVDTMFRDSPALRGRIADPKSRDGHSTILHKQFPGGHLTLVGANAPGNLAMRPVRIVLCDEVDKYPVSAGSEGDPIKLASERSATFWNRLLITTCSPTVAGTSRIEMEYEASDKRIYEVTCPHCDDMREMAWSSVTWEEGKPETARYTCPGCGCPWSEPDRLRAVQGGRWRATKPFKGHAGFKVNKLASPWESLAELAEKYESSKASPALMKTFYNTQLAETYREVGDTPEYQKLYDKRESYPIGKVPAGVVFLTAGVDVQKDRLELEVVGWAPGKRSYSVEYQVIEGDTENEGADGPWAKLRDIILGGQWESESGTPMGLRFTCVDSGFRTSIVYDFCRKVGGTRCAPIKGQEDLRLVVGSPKAVEIRRNGVKVPGGVRLFPVGVSVIKSELYAWLRLDKTEGDNLGPPGYCHFPEYDLRYFKELTSEQVMTKLVRGYPREVWEKTPGVRNEALDVRVYARAAAALVGIDRLKDTDWANLAAKAGATLPTPGADSPSVSVAPATRPAPSRPAAAARPRRSSSFW